MDININSNFYLFFYILINMNIYYLNYKIIMNYPGYTLQNNIKQIGKILIYSVFFSPKSNNRIEY